MAAKKKYLYKKASDAPAYNPWAMDQTEPSGPVPADQFGDFVGANNAKQNNDSAAQEYLAKLGKAAAVEGQVPAPAHVAPATPPITDTRVPDPVPTLDQMPVPSKGADPISLNAKGKPVGPDQSGVAMSFPAMDISSAAKPEPKTYFKDINLQRDTMRAEHTGKKDSHLTPDAYAQLLDMVKGIQHPQRMDAEGKPLYTKVPVLNEKGQPELGPDGIPALRDGDPIYDTSQSTVDESTPYQQSLASINSQKDSLDALLKYTPVQRDLSPLMQFAALMSKHPEIAQGYKAPANFADTLEKVIGGRKSVADQQNKLFSDSTAAVKTLKDGSNTDLASQILLNQASQETGNKGMNSLQDKMDLLEARQAATNHRFVMTAIDKNPAQARLLGAYRTMGNALGVLQNSPDGKIHPAQIDEFQQMLRTSMGAAQASGGRSGVEERERSYAQDLGWSVQRLRTFLSGDVGDVMQDQQTLEHLQGVAAREQQQLRAQYEKGFQELAGGFPWQYDRNDPNFDETKYGKYATGMEQKMGLVGGLMGPIGATPVTGGAAEIDQKVLKPSHKIGVERRKADAAKEAKAAGPSAIDKEIEALEKELGVRK